MRALCVAALVAAGFCTAAAADPVADFYKGKNVQIIVGYGTGGGYDVYARVLSRHFSKHLPGAPNIVIQNMPGAGSLRATNHLYVNAPKDGTTFGTFARNMPLLGVLGGNANVQFDPRKFTWLGSTNAEPSLCVAWHGSPVRTIKDLQEREFTVAATGINANSGLVPTVLNRVMGTKFKIIMGYPGSNEMSLAMERGEVEGRCGWSRSSLMTTKPTWVSEKKINLLLQAGLQKSPLMPDVPLALAGVRDEGDRQLLKLAVAWDEMAWPFAAPPGIPADRAQALRAAFAAVLKDPEIVVQAGREGLDLNLVPAENIERILDEVYATPEPILAKMKDIVRAK